MCHLFHRLNKLTPHLPQGFQPCQTPTFHVPNNEIWEMEERDLGCMKSGFHEYAGPCYLSIFVYFAENFSVNLKMVYMSHAEVQCDAAVIPQTMRYQKPLLMTGNFCLESPKARATFTGTKAGLINLEQVSGDACQEEETNSEAEPESQAIQMVGIMSFREQILMKIVNVYARSWPFTP